MGKVEVSKITYGRFEDCIKVTNGEVEFVATTTVGPRIVRFGLVGGPNEFFDDIYDNCVNKNEPDVIKTFGDYWHLYGGHRFWLAPEVLTRTPYPDNQPVEYEILENGVILTGPVQKLNFMQMQMKATMDESGNVTVLHTAKNCGQWTIECAPWGVTVMDVGGREVIPMSKQDTDLVNNRSISLWPYTKIDDPRLKIENDYIIINPNNKNEDIFKIGTNNDEGFALYYHNNNLFVNRFSKWDSKNKYPDNNVNYESYTSNFVLEMETLGKLQNLEPGATVSHIENWTLIPNVSLPKDNNYEMDIEKYIK